MCDKIVYQHASSMRSVYTILLMLHHRHRESFIKTEITLQVLVVFAIVALRRPGFPAPLLLFLDCSSFRLQR